MRRLLGSMLAVAALAAGLGAAGASGAAGAETSSPTASPAAETSLEVTAAPAASLADEAVARVAEMSVRDRARAVVMTTIASTDPATLHAYMEESGIGGFILMGDNIPAAPQQLRDLTAALTVDPALPPLIAVDEEGGDVTRLPWDDFPGADTLKNAPVADTEDAFLGRGALLQSAGIGVNFGIVADVTDDPGMFIYRRALGTTPESSAERVRAAVAGEAGQVLSTLKHFPGHGAAAGDSHHTIPTTDMSQSEWRATDAVPFQAGIEAGAPLLMFGHLVYSSVDSAPASLSSTWHEIARSDLGFQGVAITDDLGMLQASGDPDYADPVANAVSAIRAGNDMVLVVMYSDRSTAQSLVDGLVAAVDAGELPADRLAEAATRVTELRLQLAAQGRGLTDCADCAAAG